MLFRSRQYVGAVTRSLPPVALDQPKGAKRLNWGVSGATASPARHAGMIGYLSRPGLELAAGTMLRGWLLKAHQSLLVDFLNGLSIPHKDGVVDDLPETVDDAKLKSTVDALLAKHPVDVVKVYLHSFNSMNESQWKNLEALLHDDARLQF